MRMALGLVLLLWPDLPGAYEYLDRADWGAAAPGFAMQPQVPGRITLHHTAVRRDPKTGLARKMRNLQGFSQRAELLANGHVKAPWADLPYHFYIGAGGMVAEGRATGFAGDTNTGYDTSGHIAVVLEGNFEEEQPTSAQLAALVELLADLSGRYAIPAEHIGAHRDFAATACPGATLLARLPELRGAVAGLVTAAPGRSLSPQGRPER